MLNLQKKRFAVFLKFLVHSHFLRNNNTAKILELFLLLYLKIIGVNNYKTQQGGAKQSWLLLWTFLTRYCWSKRFCVCFCFGAVNIVLFVSFADLHRLGQPLFGESAQQEKGQLIGHRLYRRRSIGGCHRVRQWVPI